jgi:hypothetical protein
MTVKNMNIIVNEADDQKRIEDAIKQFEETQKDKNQVTEENRKMAKLIEDNKKEIKESN